MLFNKAYKETLSTRKEDKNNFRKVDINRIERLYKDYKNRDLSRKKLEDKINKEQGITFKPEIGTANKKNYFSYRRYHIDETSDILNRYTDQNIRTSKILKYDCDFIGDSKVEDFSSLNTNNNILNLGLNSELLRNILNS